MILAAVLCLGCSRTHSADERALLPPMPEGTGGAAGASASHPVLGRDGKALAQPVPDKYSTGALDCPPPVAVGCGDLRESKACQLHEWVECRPGCAGYRSSAFVCEDGHWQLREAREPPCICEPEPKPPELAACTTRQVTVSPSELSPTDQCGVALSCRDRDLWVECDGESDGTGTSLCSCWLDRRPVTLRGNPYTGEGPRACFSAAVACVAAGL